VIVVWFGCGNTKGIKNMPKIKIDFFVRSNEYSNLADRGYPNGRPQKENEKINVVHTCDYNGKGDINKGKYMTQESKINALKDMVDFLKKSKISPILEELRNNKCKAKVKELIEKEKIQDADMIELFVPLVLMQYGLEECGELVGIDSELDNFIMEYKEYYDLFCFIITEY
jgi:hypothetical protein